VFGLCRWGIDGRLNCGYDCHYLVLYIRRKKTQMTLQNLALALVVGSAVGTIIWLFGIQLAYGLVLLVMMILYIFVTPIYWFAEFIHRFIIFLRRQVLVNLESRMQ
jgi:hypothetical protein